MQNPFFKRQHHYIFAYHALRENIEQAPVELMRALTKHGALFLFHLWETAGKVAMEQRNADYLPPDGLSMNTYQLDSGRKLVVVALPQPKYANEAAYIGFTTKIILLNSKKPKILEQSRYFAYELVIAPGQVEEQEPRFAFCEWGKNNVHSNMGFF